MDRWFLTGVILGFILLLFETKGKLFASGATDFGGTSPDLGGGAGGAGGRGGGGAGGGGGCGCGCGGIMTLAPVANPAAPLTAPSTVRAPSRWMQVADVRPTSRPTYPTGLNFINATFPILTR